MNIALHKHQYHNRDLETADRSVIAGLQLERLRHLLAKTWSENSFYADRWRAAGISSPDISSIEDFRRRFPLVRKADFVADQEAMPPYGQRTAHALNRREPLVVMTTSGTSGQGVEVHAETHNEREAAAHISNFMYRWAGLERGDRVFLMFPVAMLGGGRIEIHGLEAYGLTVFPVGSFDIGRKIDLIKRFQPHALLGTTSYLGHIAAVAGDALRDWRPKVLFGGGEGGGYAWFERLQNSWNAPIWNQYGATQTRVDSAFTCERGIGTREVPGILHNIDPYFLMEVINPQTGEHVRDGESGEIVMTSLIHTDVPLIRCGMRDVGLYRPPGACPCGRSFCGLEVGSITRSDDMVKVKGVNVWPQAVDDVLQQVRGMDDYQIVVSVDESMRDVVTARIMPDQTVDASGLDDFCSLISSNLSRRIGIAFRVEVLPVGSLARSEYKARRWIDSRGRRD